MISWWNLKSRATVWLGVDGFWKRGKSTVHVEGITMNQPIIIETIDIKEKIEPLISSLKRIINDNGLITIYEVQVVWYFLEYI